MRASTNTLCGTIAVLAVTLSCATSAFASAGAPDPSFGTQGAQRLPGLSTRAYDTSSGAPVVLPSGELVVPVYRRDFRMRKGEQVGVRAFSVHLVWLNASGATVRTSPPVALPVDVSATLARTADGHLILAGVRRTLSGNAKSIYLVRLSESGVPEPAPGAASAITAVAVSSIANTVKVGVHTESVTLTVAPSGRVFALVRQEIATKVHGYNQVTGYGPVVLGAIDPSTGLAASFAGGGLVVANATDARTTTNMSVAADDAGRVLALIHSVRQGVGGTSQDVHVTRFDSTGATDQTFGNAGTIDISVGSVDTAYGAPRLALMHNGDVLVRLDETTDSGGIQNSGVELRRYSALGVPAAGFGTAGRAVIVLQTARSSGDTSNPRSDRSEGPAVFELPDGKLIVALNPTYRMITARSYVSLGDVLRTTATGALDTSYEQRGFARFDIPQPHGDSALLIGADSDGRALGMIAAASATNARTWLVRLLGGDEPAPTTSTHLAVDHRAACGHSPSRSCFDANGLVHITGTLSAGGTPLAGAPVIISLSRPASAPVRDVAPVLPAAISSPAGTFSIAVPKQLIFPGAWVATPRVLATARSQRLDTAKPVYFTLGPRRDIALLKTLQKAQALATIADEVISDTVDYTDADSDDANVQCKTLDLCFGASPKLRALISATQHPAPGRIGVILGKPDHYTVVVRANTKRFRLEFVVQETPDDYTMTCRGDAAARKRWCPDGEWYSSFDDEFAFAGIDGAPFDYAKPRVGVRARLRG